jgi:flagellar motor switch protein FliN/FliY
MSTPAIDHFGDVSVGIQVELGRSILKLRQILELAPGSVISTSKHVGDDLGVFAEGVRLGCGEIVVRDNSLAVRLTEIGDAR